MNKWIASIIFSFALHFAILLGYDLSSRNFTEKVDKKITGIKFIEPEKKQKKNEVLTKSSIQNITNEENLVQKPKTIEENPTDVKQKHEETTLEKQAMELIDLISQKVILDIQKIWISPNNQDHNIYAEFLLTLVLLYTINGKLLFDLPSRKAANFCIDVHFSGEPYCTGTGTRLPFSTI